MPPTKKSKKILVSEDEQSMREIVVEKLQSANYNVVQAEDGAIAIKQFEKELPDLVLLDLMMPEVDGFGVLEHIRKHKNPKTAQTPVIILTNLWSKEEIIKTKNLGVQAYIIKAYMTTEEILEKVTEVLDGVSGNRIQTLKKQLKAVFYSTSTFSVNSGSGLVCG